MTVDSDGVVYATDYYYSLVRMVTLSRFVTTVGGSSTALSAIGGYANGDGTAAQFYSPIGMDMDTLGNTFVADYHYGYIRKMSILFCPSGQSLSGSSCVTCTAGTDTQRDILH